MSICLHNVYMPSYTCWQIYFKKKKTGGISFNSTLALTHVDEKLCYQILHEYKIHNAEVLLCGDFSWIYLRNIHVFNAFIFLIFL